MGVKGDTDAGGDRGTGWGRQKQGTPGRRGRWGGLCRGHTQRLQVLRREAGPCLGLDARRAGRKAAEAGKRKD